jgi:aminomethyltransferase
MIDFGGWEMQDQYSGIIDEHHAVRERAGLFDVSHMGEIEVRGPQALELVNYVTTNNASKLTDGRAQYSGLLYSHGGFVDDILVHRVHEREFFLCVNASNQTKDFEHIRSQNKFDATVEFASDRYVQLALQGPKALTIAQQLATLDLSGIRYSHCVDEECAGRPARIARTGYTGEDGFEVYAAPEHAEYLWKEIMAAGEPHGILPCGLGARNTLRMEAGMALYGHEIDATVLPPEANLSWIVKLDKDEFVGRERVAALMQNGLRRKLVGFEVQGKQIAREGYPVLIDGADAGWVTSGGPSPTLKKNIGMAFLPAASADDGATIEISIRNRLVEAIVVPIPFYKRKK